MNVSTLCKASSLSWVLATSWTGQLEAASDCLSALEIEAPPVEKANMRARLRGGKLAEVSEDHCHAQVRLEQKGSRWELQFTHGDTSIVRNVKSPDLAAVWVESWLMPVTSLNLEPDPNGTEKGAAPPVSSSDSNWRMGLEGAAALFGAAGSWWLGPTLRFHGRVRGLWFLEPHLGLGTTMFESVESSRSMWFSTAFGRDIVHTSKWILRPSCSIGFMSLLWRKYPSEVRVTGPMLGGQFAASYALSRSVWLVGRVHTSVLSADRLETRKSRICSEDDRCDDPDRGDAVSNKRTLDPNWVGGLDLGVTIYWGDPS
jgi:hypothetical protein